MIRKKTTNLKNKSQQMLFLLKICQMSTQCEASSYFNCYIAYLANDFKWKTIWNLLPGSLTLKYIALSWCFKCGFARVYVKNDKFMLDIFVLSWKTSTRQTCRRQFADPQNSYSYTSRLIKQYNYNKMSIKLNILLNV